MKLISTVFFIFFHTISQVFGGSINKITPHEALKMSKDQMAILVDVREIDEIKAGTIKNSLQMPLSLMSNDKKTYLKNVEDRIGKEKTVILFCRSGRRSGIVASELQKEGFKVLNLGAYDDWVKSGLN